MQELTPGNRSFYWSAVFIRELYKHGLEYLFISPGSRSTPLVMASAIHPGLKKEVILDERSAAFAALGIGKATVKPAGLICTSGTALANYFPAVVEARHSGIPLLILSADRPPNLRNIGASQAIDQVKIFGNYPVFFHEMGEPAVGDSDQNRLKQLAGQAVYQACKHRGAAHLNFAFRKPLEPDPDMVEELKKENERLAENGDTSPMTSFYLNNPSRQTELPREIHSAIDKSSRPVVIAGPLNPYLPVEPITLLAEQLNAPLLAEASVAHKDQGIKGFSGFLRSKKLSGSLKPDLVLRFGQTPVSKALNQFLKSTDSIPHIHFATLDEWQDAGYTVTHRLEFTVETILPDSYEPETDPEWLNHWKQAELMFADHREEAMANQSKLTDGNIFSDITGRLPSSWNIFVSNSFPVRDLDLFGYHKSNPVYMNRGASGIDGVLSTAIGATLATKKPGILFIGDLAFLHDSNALLSAALVKETALKIFVLNNRGGTIFRMLPVTEHSDYFTPYFETPQDVQIENLAKAHDIPYTEITSDKELHSLAGQSFNGNSKGMEIVECITDPDASMELRNTLWSFDD